MIKFELALLCCVALSISACATSTPSVKLASQASDNFVVPNSSQAVLGLVNSLPHEVRGSYNVEQKFWICEDAACESREAIADFKRISKALWDYKTVSANGPVTLLSERRYYSKIVGVQNINAGGEDKSRRCTASATFIPEGQAQYIVQLGQIITQDSDRMTRSASSDCKLHIQNAAPYI